MPPKKREKPTDKDSNTDQVKTDRELFLQAFESKYFILMSINKYIVSKVINLTFFSFYDLFR